MKSFHKGNWVIVISLSFLATVFTLANINAQDKDGNTPLLWLMGMDHFEDGRSTKDIIDVLLAAGADTTITNKAGKSAKDYKETR